MKIDYFREFITLAKYLNFSVASELLNMTQPGLSRHIATLEKEVGVTLLERDTHGVRLTQAGTQFLEGIKRIVDDYDALCEKVLHGGAQQLHIGVPYFGINRYLSDMVSGFEASHPQVKLKYLPAYPEAIIDALLAKQADLAILPRVDSLNSERLIFHDAFREPLTVIMHREHPLASRKSLHLIDLKDEHFISIQGYYTGAMVEYQHDFCRQAGYEPQTIMTVNTIEEAVLKMKPDMGVMLMPGHLKEATISANVKCIDIADSQCYLTISLWHHPENDNPLIGPFIEHYLKLSAEGEYD